MAGIVVVVVVVVVLVVVLAVFVYLTKIQVLSPPWIVCLRVEAII